jgi:5-formyltetrahydrofolate cyclo-ligase
MTSPDSKTLLRTKLLQDRKNLHDAYENLAQNNAIYDKVFNLLGSLYDKFLSDYKDNLKMDAYCVLGLYWPLKGEPDLLKLAITTKWALSLPKIINETDMEYVRYQLASSLEPFENTKIMQPAGNVSITPKVIVLPGLAFGINGYRLGFGNGYYDRYINQIRKSSELITIGVCFHENLLEYLPNSPHDAKLDYIITDQVILKT